MAWRFNGVNSYATLAYANAMTFPNANWAVGGHVRFLGNAGTSTAYLHAWGAIGASQDATLLFYQASHANANRMRIYWKDGNGDIVDLTTDVTPGASRVWQHLLVQRSSGTVTMYIDGVDSGSVEHSGLVDLYKANQSLNLGANYVGASPFFGQMAEWAKWDRALSAAEIAVLVKGATPDWFANGLAWYLPMRKEPVELVRGIPVKLVGATPVDHPLHFRSAPMGWAARALGVAP